MADTWLVYKHTSNSSGKSYIGMTKRTMEERWAQHVYKAFQGSPFHFHNAISLYGDVDWSHTVLSSGIPTIDEAKVVERDYIRKYDTFENGYNMTSGGDGGEARIARVVEGSFYNPELDILELNIKALDFSDKYELNDRTVYELVKGQHKSVHGWYIWTGPNGKYYRSKSEVFEHPEYGIVECSPGELAREYGLHAGNVSNVVNGNRTHTGGWKLAQKGER